MSDPIQLDTAAEAVLSSLQAMFSSVAVVVPVSLKHPRLVADFRPGSGKETDLADVPKPALDWAFAVDLDVTPDGTRLCAVVFRKWSRLAAFYNANPVLAATLISTWRGAAAIWMRATGRIPGDFTADNAHWCATGMVPVACPKRGPETFLAQPGEIGLIEFSQLVWNERQQAEVERALLEAEVGPPFRVVARGRRTLNLAFWARYFTDMMPIAYEPGSDVFEWGDPKVRQPVLLTVDETTREFTNLLQAAAPSFGAEFPQGEIRPARVRQLVERVKLLTTKSRVSDDEVLDSFLMNQVVRAPGKNITSHEFQAAFARYCGNIKRVTAPASWFYRRLGPKLRAQFHVGRRHDIVRNGTKVRGFGGLALREVAVKGPDGSDATDGSDGAQDTL
jgi:hypothetical protein